MILQTALRAGLTASDAMIMPLSMCEDIIASWQITTQGFKREFTDPDDQEDEFQRMMALN